jgi:hypothetical protein
MGIGDWRRRWDDRVVRLKSGMVAWVGVMRYPSGGLLLWITGLERKMMNHGTHRIHGK